MRLKKCQLSIWREDPDRPGESYLQRFSVPHDPMWSVLQALEYISGELDPSLAYRSSCQAGRCGVCRMLINGKIRFACREFLAEKLEIRAWQPGAVVRDLVVKEGHGMGKARGVRTTSITGDIRRGKPKLKPR